MPYLRLSLISLALSLVQPATAETLKDCRSLYVRAMPESLDGFISSALVKWGEISVANSEAKADCYMRLAGSGSPQEEIPTRNILGVAERHAAVQVVHRQSDAIVWAATKEGTYMLGPGRLASRIVGQFKKDHKKSRQPNR